MPSHKARLATRQDTSIANYPLWQIKHSLVRAFHALLPRACLREAKKASVPSRLADLYRPLNDVKSIGSSFVRMIAQERYSRDKKTVRGGSDEREIEIKAGCTLKKREQGWNDR